MTEVSQNQQINTLVAKIHALAQTSPSDQEPPQHSEIAQCLKEAIENKDLLSESGKQVQDDLTAVWLKYAQMVRDYETVYRYMLHNEIGTTNANLFLKWAFCLEKYRRNFDAANLVLQEGIKRVCDENQEKLLIKRYSEFAERMKLRIKRDILKTLDMGESLSNLQTMLGP